METYIFEFEKDIFLKKKGDLLFIMIICEYISSDSNFDHY